MSFTNQFIQKDWRDSWDTEAGGWKEDSWYPGRNISRFMDQTFSPGDTFRTGEQWDTPSDKNPFLTDVAGHFQTSINSLMDRKRADGSDGWSLDEYSKWLMGHPTQDAANLAQSIYPNESGSIYGITMDRSENVESAPEGGFIKTGHNYTGPVDTQGNLVQGLPGQYGSQWVDTDRWYPGKGLKNIWGMVTGQKNWGNPFDTEERFYTGQWGDVPDYRTENKAYRDYKGNHPYYDPYTATESGGFTGGTLNYDMVRDDLENYVGNTGLIGYTQE